MGPFSLQAPTVDELLLWHSQYGIRFIDIAVERSAQWLMALAGLNLALRRYGEPGWSFKHVVGAEINASRRTLFHVPRDAITPSRRRAGETASQTGVFRVQRMRTRNQSARVQDVRACWRSCPENVIQFDDNTLTIAAAALYGMRRRVRRYVRIRRCGCGLTWNPRQRGIVRCIRSPAKAANVLSMLSRLNTRTACCVSPLSLLCAFNFLLLMLILF